ncbi:MAG: RHS repeat protein [Bacteroidia bacterium]|nr:RHS repeat protein [Bacteroidia bacterium]
MKRLLLTLLLLFSAWQLSAQTSTFAYRRGTQLSVLNSVVNAQSEFFSSSPAGFYTNSEKMRVKLAYVDVLSVPNFYPDCWQLTIRYDVTVYTNSTTSSTISNETLTINHENNSGTRIQQDIAFKEYTGIRASVKITGFDFRTRTGCITLGSTTAAFPSAGIWSNVNWDEIELSAQYIADRTYLNLTTSSISHTPAGTALCGTTQSGFTTAASNMVTIQWAATNSAVRYDLEWVFIDLPGTTPFNARYEFNWDNATRVSTTSSSFKLPLAYPRGKFIYRYRVVRKEKDSNGNYYLKEEDWSRPGGLRGERNLDETQNNGSMANGNYFNYCGMELQKNWSYGSGYSEDALRSEGLAFFDAMGRNRQSIGYMQTDGNAVISETYYDREGRPAAGSMPVPLSSQGTKFYNGFGAGFDYPNNYEANPGGFTGLPSTHKASEFYSTSSPFAASFPQVPSAQGYALSQVKYLNNGDGMMQEASAPGPDHRMGSTHTQIVRESNPTQNELDRVFGNEIGYAAHYKKIETKDANGQTSVRYVDGSGRTVATALYGVPAISNVQQLANSPQATTVSVLNQSQPQPDGSVFSQTEYSMKAGEVRSFTYNLAAASQYLPCLDKSYGCYYDVEIQVLNDQDSAQVLTTSGGNTTLFVQSGIASASNVSFSFTVPADGIYRILKTTRLSAGFIDDKAAAVQADIIAAGISPANACVPIDSPAVNCPSCADNCVTAWTHTLLLNGNPVTVYDHPNGDSYTSVQLLADAYPNDVEFDGGGGKINDVLQIINKCVLDCQADSNVIIADPCVVQRMLLLKDMSPGGQYFDNFPVTYEMDLAEPADLNAWLEIFAGPALGELALAFPILPPSPYWDDVRANWDPAMAELLLPYHPEYCKYDYFCNFINNVPELCGKEGESPNHWGSSSGYDTGINSIQDDSTALALGLFDPLNGNNNFQYSYHLSTPKNPEVNTPADYAGVCDHADPFFADPFFSTLKSEMQDRLKKYIPNPFVGGYFSIWDILDPDAILSGNTFNMGDPDEASLHAFLTMLSGQFSSGSLTPYQFFRAYYSFHKLALIQNGYTLYVMADRCSSCSDPTLENCINCASSQNDCPDCFLSAFDADSDGQVDPGNLQTSCGEYNFGGFQIRYPYNPVYTAMDNNGGVPTYCDNTCEGYATAWINQLKAEYTGCVNWMDPSKEAMLKQALIDECLASCLGTPPGSGTPNYNGAQVVVQEFISDYNNNNSPKIEACPELNTTPGSATQDYTDCQCTNLAQILESSGALNYEFVTELNPVKIPYYLSQGFSIGELVNTTAATTFINNALAQIDYSGPAMDWPQIQNWLALCGEAGVTTLPGLPAELNCGSDTLNVLDCAALTAEANQATMETAFNNALAIFMNNFRNSLHTGCTSTLAARESLTMTYIMGEYHHTLYYYDRAGNLVKTVPPQGVVYLNESDIQACITYRNSSHTSATYAYTPSGTDLLLSSGFKRPNHFLATNYKYNSLNQLTESYTPDEGKSTYLYDEHSRLLLTRNAKQQTQDHYAYLRYDNLGRVYESGELTSATVVAQKDAQNTTYTGSFFSTTASTRTQVTLTLFNETQTTTGLSSAVSNHIVQRRNAVVSTLYFEATPNGTSTNYLHATHYQYDVHGNVQKSVQDFPFLNQFYARFATTEYTYNLVNGQVKEVAYNSGKKDQYFHRYTYDADGRVIRVETSRDKLWWDVDARYFYNPLGQLHRQEIGDNKVQGLDYVYTLHGMLKGINGSVLHPGLADPGRDGLSFGLTNTNNRFARDGFGFTLSYYEGDYVATGGSNARAQFASTDIYSSNTGNLMPMDAANKRGFWNGNIAATSTALMSDAEVNQDVLTQVYVYDVLMRLNEARSFTKSGVFANNQNLLTGTGLTNAWTGVTETNKWRSEYSYDANGNIRNLKRYDQGGTLMDNLTYTYEEPSARLNTNRLLHVQDAVSSSANPTDFEVTAAYNPSNPYYAYDQIGNLAKDVSEQIDNIEWDVYGKLKKVDRNSASSKPDIEFFYNSAGQRIMKLVKPNGGTGAMSTWKYTIWAYDLGGNVMAEYGIDYVTASNKYTINAKSHFLYGAGRLGKDLRDSTDYVPLAFRPTGAYTEVQSCSSCATDAVAAPGSYLYGPTVVHTRQLGYKQFELSNHTGNILMVVSDRKNAVDIGTWVAGSTSYNTASFDRKLDYYVADVVEVTDYYPGGMPMPGRSIVDTKFSTYAAGHNGHFNDDEIYGKGNTQMAEFWEYDARLMRRWNTDPLAHAGQSLYEAFYSNPIAFADPLGLKPEGGPGKKTPMGWPEKGHPDIPDLSEIEYPNNKGNDQSSSPEEISSVYYGINGYILGKHGNGPKVKEYIIANYYDYKTLSQNNKVNKTTHPDELPNKKELPPKKIREGMYTGLVTRNIENDRREYGGYVGMDSEGNIAIVWAKPGKEVDINTKPEDAELNPFDSEDSELKDRYQKVLWVFHSHLAPFKQTRIAGEDLPATSSGTVIGGNGGVETDLFNPWPTHPYDYDNAVYRKIVFPELIGHLVFGFGTARGRVYGNHVYLYDHLTEGSSDHTLVRKQIQIFFDAWILMSK